MSKYDPEKAFHRRVLRGHREKREVLFRTRLTAMMNYFPSPGLCFS